MEAEHQRRGKGPGLGGHVGRSGHQDIGFFVDLPDDGVFQASRPAPRSRRWWKSGPRASWPAGQAGSVAPMDQHDHGGIDAREAALCAGASGAGHDEAAFGGPVGCAADAAVPVAFLPEDHRPRVGQQGRIGLAHLARNLPQTQEARAGQGRRRLVTQTSRQTARDRRGGPETPASSCPVATSLQLFAATDRCKAVTQQATGLPDRQKARVGLGKGGGQRLRQAGAVGADARRRSQ